MSGMRVSVLLAAGLVGSALPGADAIEWNAPTAEFLELKSSFEDPHEGWIRLFNGRDLADWAPQNYSDRPPKPSDWRVPVLIVLDPDDDTQLTASPYPSDAGEIPPAFANNERGRSANLATKQEFADVELYIEYAVPRKSNAGICLMGNYEIQLYDSYGKPDAELNYRDDGGIYAFRGLRGRVGGRPPRVNVSRPPGRWQSLQVWFRAPRFGPDSKKIDNARFLRVLHNGVEIHGPYELLRSTRARPPWPERAAAPLLIQEDHGPAAFRNVYIRPLKKQ